MTPSQLMKNDIDEVKEAMAKWAHPELMKIWAIVQMPDWEDGEPVLWQGDIEQIARSILALNAELNKPEIKGLLQHFAKKEKTTNPPSA